MNKSGEAISQTLNYYKLIPKNLNFFQKKDTNLKEKLVIIHDDLDIEIGKIKISENSSSAGHKGVESIITHLKTKNFIRIRVGIKKPIELEKIPTEKYVLTKFSNNEINKIKEAWNNLYSIIKEKIDL